MKTPNTISGGPFGGSFSNLGKRIVPPTGGNLPKGYDKLRKNDDDVHLGKVRAFAFPGETNFAGPNWSRSITYRMRPQNDFDLAAKLHDLCYILNDIDVAPVTTAAWQGFKKSGTLTGATLAASEFRHETMGPVANSRAAKADELFRLIVDASPRRTNKVVDWASKLLFVQKGQFDLRPDDGFINPLVDEGWRAYLNQPGNILMIPFDAVQFPQKQPTSRFRRALNRAEGFAGDMYFNYTPNFGWGTADAIARRRYDTPALEDTTPGFLSWFEQRFKAILPLLYGLDSDACKFGGG